jgi:hypothetical protein
MPDAVRYIEEFITERAGEEIGINDNELTFKVSFFRVRKSSRILDVIEGGKFQIIDNGDTSILTYEFFMYRFFIFVSILGSTMALLSGHIEILALMLLWVGGMNWIIALIRHKLMLNKISKGIELNCRLTYK